MPFSELLSQTYEPGDVDLMQRAFDSAWKQLGSSVHGHEKDAAVRDILGRAIVTLFGAGMRDEEQLRRSALHIVAGL